MEQNRFDNLGNGNNHSRNNLPASRIQPLGGQNPAHTSATVRASPFRGEKNKPVKKSKRKTRKPPPHSERNKAKSLLPDLNDGGRWSLENEGYGWKVRRVLDINGTTQTKRYFRIRWNSWDALRKENQHVIRAILAEKVYRKQQQ